MHKKRRILNNKYRITDSHTHIYPEKIAKMASKSIGEFYDLPMEYTGTSKQLLENGKKINTEKYLVCSVATSSHQVKTINDFIIQECLLHKEFVGLGAMHQDFIDVEEEIERVYAKGLKGIKMHHDFQKAYIDDIRFMRTYKKAAGMDMVCLLHAGDDRYDYTRPERFLSIMDKVPNLKCIAAHFGGYKCWDQAYNMLKDVEGLYFDTSSSLFALTPGEALDIIRAFGSDKFLFGTDFPMWDHETELDRFLKLALTDQEIDLILYRNFYKLFS